MSRGGARSGAGVTEGALAGRAARADAAGVDASVAKGVVILASVGLAVVRAPYVGRRRTAPARSYRGRLERALVTLVRVAAALPAVWAMTPLLAPADLPVRPLRVIAGVPLLGLGLILLHRSHRDLGAQWSITLEVREEHRLVTSGIYRRVRHPMYLAYLVHSAGLALAVSNWLAGAAPLVAFTALVLLRVPAEERMLLAEFGTSYEEYRARTHRLVPHVW